MLIAALRAGDSDPVAYIDDLQPDLYVIDGKFDLEVTTRILSEMLHAPHAESK